MTPAITITTTTMATMIGSGLLAEVAFTERPS
jgi:hypothetical protein